MLWRRFNVLLRVNRSIFRGGALIVLKGVKLGLFLTCSKNRTIWHSTLTVQLPSGGWRGLVVLVLLKGYQGALVCRIRNSSILQMHYVLLLDTHHTPRVGHSHVFFMGGYDKHLLVQGKGTSFTQQELSINRWILDRCCQLKSCYSRWRHPILEHLNSSYKMKNND